MWFKSKPIFSDSVGRGVKVPNKPIFCDGKGIEKKPSDVNDVSRAKLTYNQREPDKNPSEAMKESITKNAKTIKSKTGNIDDNKWMWIFMKRARQV
jgi:hypothetical protein